MRKLVSSILIIISIMGVLLSCVSEKSSKIQSFIEIEETFVPAKTTIVLPMMVLKTNPSPMENGKDNSLEIDISSMKDFNVPTVDVDILSKMKGISKDVIPLPKIALDKLGKIPTLDGEKDIYSVFNTLTKIEKIKNSTPLIKSVIEVLDKIVSLGDISLEGEGVLDIDIDIVYPYVYGAKNLVGKSLKEVGLEPMEEDVKVMIGVLSLKKALSLKNVLSSKNGGAWKILYYDVAEKSLLPIPTLIKIQNLVGNIYTKISNDLTKK